MPGFLAPAEFLPAVPPALPPPPLPVVVVLPLPDVVVVLLVELVEPPLPPEPPVEIGALYSEVSSGPLQPGSPRSTRPSPSSSLRLAHCGRTPSVGAFTCTFPTVIEVAVPA